MMMRSRWTRAPGHENHRMNISRRRLLAGTAGTAALALSDHVRAALAQLPHGAPSDATAPAPTAPAADPGAAPGRIPSELGQRSAFEQPRRRVTRALPSGSSESPLQELHGVITPADLHFERHHGGVPNIDPATYSLLIHGMVDRPLKFSLADLKRFPSRTRTYFLECSGNGARGFNLTSTKRETPPSMIDGLFSTSEWTGVPLKTLFHEVGVQPRGTWFLAEGMDSAHMTRSIPVEKALDDAMIVYAQNGEAIRPEQGYPARLLLPGWEGNANIKWVHRLEVSDQPSMTREETSKYTDPLADGTARQFSFVIDAKSLITHPAYPDELTPGWQEITGLAWSGRGAIAKVEVSTDGGRSWADAELDTPVLAKCTTRFRHPWRWDGAPARLMSRATDDTGYVQPTTAALIAARGPGTSYHYNNIRAWDVERDGRVFFHTAV
jgi:sulfane dehydrogenase subunit SoxC